MIGELILITGMLISNPDLHNGTVNLPEKNTELSYGKWEKVKSTDGVVTSVRWLYKSDGSKTRERKGEIQANSSTEKAFELLTNATAMKQWMSGVSENYRISRLSACQWYTYTLYNMPWPFNKRDLVSEYEIINQPGKKCIRIIINSRADFVPLKPGIERLIDYKAVWTIKEISRQQVHISFNVISNTPPLFPGFIQDPVIEKDIS